VNTFLNTKIKNHPLMVSYLIWLIPRISIVLLSYFNILPIALSTGYTVGGIGVSYHYPGYMLFSKLVHMLTLNNYITYVLMHCAVASLGGIFVYRLSTLLGYRSSLKWISVIGVGFMPYYFSATLCQPQFSVAFMVTTWWIVEVYHWFLDPLSKKRALWVSVASVIAYLFRPYFIGLFVLAIGCIFRLVYKKVKLQQAFIKIGYSVVIFVCFFLLMKGVTHYFTIVSDKGHVGLNLAIANNHYIPVFAQKYDISHWLEGVDSKLVDYVGGDILFSERNQVLTEYVIKYIKDNPIQVLKNMGWKAYRFFHWRLDDADKESWFKNLLYTLPYIFYMPLGILGALRLLYLNNRDEKLMLYFILFAFYSFHIFIFHGGIRHRMYTEALPIIFSVYGGYWLMGKIRFFYIGKQNNK